MAVWRLHGLLSEMSRELQKALSLVAARGAQIAGDWWIIGSTAALLSGFNAFEPDDVDLFGHCDVMTAFVRALGHEPVASPNHHQFKSTPYHRIKFPGATPIEVMGGLEVLCAGQWQSLSIKSRVEISGFGAQLWVPSIEEQIAIFHLFGRPKDLAKAAILRWSIT